MCASFGEGNRGSGGWSVSIRGKNTKMGCNRKVLGCFYGKGGGASKPADYERRPKKSASGSWKARVARGKKELGPIQVLSGDRLDTQTGKRGGKVSGPS